MISQTAAHRYEARAKLTNSDRKPVKGVHRWHALEPSAVASLLKVDPSQGLTELDVAKRRLRYGPNNSEAIRFQHVTGMLTVLFLSVVAGFLLTAALLNSVTRNKMEVLGILSVVVIVSTVAFARVLKSARALDALNRATRSGARVIREGQENKVEARELVPGDIILLTAGHRVPADARIIDASHLRLKETTLTGRKHSVKKLSSAVLGGVSLGQRQSMAYLGSKICSGHGAALVVATGAHTELGKRASGER